MWNVKITSFGTFSHKWLIIKENGSHHIYLSQRFHPSETTIKIILFLNSHSLYFPFPSFFSHIILMRNLHQLHMFTITSTFPHTLHIFTIILLVNLNHHHHRASLTSPEIEIAKQIIYFVWSTYNHPYINNIINTHTDFKVVCLLKNAIVTIPFLVSNSPTLP